MKQRPEHKGAMLLAPIDDELIQLADGQAGFKNLVGRVQNFLAGAEDVVPHRVHPADEHRLHALADVARPARLDFVHHDVAVLERTQRRHDVVAVRLRTGGPLQHRRQLAAFLDHRVNHRRVNFALAHARARGLSHRVDRFFDQLDRFGESVDLLRALDVPGSLHQIGGVDEGCVREGFLDGAHGAVRHDAFRRPADVVESRDADAPLVDVELAQPLDDPPAEEAVAVAHVGDPVLEGEPVVDRRDRHRDRRDFAL